MKNLKLSVITVSFGFIFLLVNGAMDLYAYHDHGPLHIDGDLVASIHASNHKAKTPPLIPETIFSLILPETPLHLGLLSVEVAHPPALPFFSQFPTRASPTLT